VIAVTAGGASLREDQSPMTDLTPHPDRSPTPRPGARESTPPGRPAARAWVIAVLVVVAAVTGRALLWNHDHPRPRGWDEARYVHHVLLDARASDAAGIEGIVSDLMRRVATSPPGYRLVAAPLAVADAITVRRLRLVSIGTFLVAIGFTFAAGRAIAGTAGGAAAAIVVSTAPGLLVPMSMFATEGPLLAAIAATVWALASFRPPPGDAARPADGLRWVPLGLAIGLGLLSKLTFAIVGGALVGLTVLASPLLRGGTALRDHCLKGGLLGALIAMPWYAHNAVVAVGFARSSSDYSGRSELASRLDHPSLLIAGGLGLPLAAALAVLVASRPWSAPVAAGPAATSRRRWTWVAILACSAAPLIVMHLLGRNHALRIVGPALLPVAIALGTLVPARPPRPAAIAAALLVVAQVGLLWWPMPDRLGGPDVRRRGVNALRMVFQPRAQWDWTAMIEWTGERWPRPAEADAVAWPVEPTLSIGHLGIAPPLNYMQIRCAWAERGRMVDASLLWRFEDGAVDLDELVERAAGLDLVLVAPELTNPRAEHGSIDNERNAAFAEALRRSDRFDAPRAFPMGEPPTEVLAFPVRPVTSDPPAAGAPSDDPPGP